MLLAIEQGNTNTLFAVHDGERWVAQWRAATDASRTADEYAAWLAQLLGMAHLSLAAMDGCIVSSVVPQSIFNLRNLARRYLHVEPMVIGENVDLGIDVRIAKPSEAGADRLVNAIGAHVAHQTNSKTIEIRGILRRQIDEITRSVHQAPANIMAVRRAITSEIAKIVRALKWKPPNGNDSNGAVR